MQQVTQTLRQLEQSQISAYNTGAAGYNTSSLPHYNTGAASFNSSGLPHYNTGTASYSASGAQGYTPSYNSSYNQQPVNSLHSPINSAIHAVPSQTAGNYNSMSPIGSMGQSNSYGSSMNQGRSYQ
ncbi:hypothetical protein D3C73_1316710 [compost metagenome]